MVTPAQRQQEISNWLGVDLPKRGEPSCVEVEGKTRSDLARMFSVVFCDESTIQGVEVGVKQGEYSAELLAASPNLHLRSVDPWTVRDDYFDGRSQDQFEQLYQDTVKRLSVYPGSEIIRKPSLEAAQDIPDRSLDFVYLDGHHSFQAVTNDIVEWSKKIKLGGIIAGHDYAYYRQGSDIAVKEVVDAYTLAYHIRPWWVLGAKAKVDGVPRDRYRSFLWVVDDWPTPATRARRRG